MPYLETVPGIAQPEVVPYDRRSGDELLRTLWRLFRTSRAMRQPYEGQWAEFWKGWEGSLALSETDALPKHYFNHIWKVTEQVVARLTEELPEWNVLPVERDDEELARVMEKYLEWTTRCVGAAGPLQEGIRSAEVAGTAIWKTPWNPDLSRGRGNNELYCCDLLRLYPDLSKTRLDQMTFLIQEFFLETAYIRRRWGVDVPPVQVFSDLETDQGLVTTANRSTAFGTANLPIVYGSPEGTIITGRTRVLECWIRDFVVASTGIAIPEPQRHKAKHPDWYLVYVTEDRLLPHQGAPEGNGVVHVPYSEPPYVVYKPITSPLQFYGVSPTHPLLDPQRDYNEAREQLREHRVRLTQPHMTVDPRYPIDMREFANRDQPMPVPPGAIQYLLPPVLGPEVMQAINMGANDLEDISGVHDVSRGQRVPQLTAGVAISALQQKAETRINARVPLLTEALVKVGKNWLSNGAQQLGLAGMLRLAGASDPNLSKIDFAAFVNETRDVLDFDVQVTVGSSAAERTELQNMAVLLAQAGHLDAESVLEMFRVPGRYRILERIERSKQEAAMLQAAQQVGQTQGEAPNPYSDETVAGAQDMQQLPPELQNVLAVVGEYLGPDVMNFAFRGLQRERGAALAVTQAGAA